MCRGRRCSPRLSPGKFRPFPPQSGIAYRPLITPQHQAEPSRFADLPLAYPSAFFTTSYPGGVRSTNLPNNLLVQGPILADLSQEAALNRLRRPMPSHPVHKASRMSCTFFPPTTPSTFRCQPTSRFFQAESDDDPAFLSSQSFCCLSPSSQRRTGFQQTETITSVLNRAVNAQTGQPPPRNRGPTNKCGDGYAGTP